MEVGVGGGGCVLGVMGLRHDSQNTGSRLPQPTHKPTLSSAASRAMLIRSSFPLDCTDALDDDRNEVPGLKPKAEEETWRSPRIEESRLNKRRA